MKEDSAAVKGHGPRVAQTIDGTSLPQDQPTSALQTLRSRRDGALPLKRSRRHWKKGRPPSKASETHEASSQRVDGARSAIFRGGRARLAPTSLTHNRLPIAIVPSLWSSLVTDTLDAIDLQGENTTLIRPLRIFHAAVSRSAAQKSS